LGCTLPTDVLDDLEAEFVPLRLVQPIAALGGRTAEDGASGRINARRVGSVLNLPIADYFAIADILLSGICGLRINVRVLRSLGARQRKRRPDPVSDFIAGELERIRLRDTVGLEIAGFAVGI
jgi:hypothetical protein